MIIYCDASVIVAALTAEPFSALARNWLDNQPHGSLVQSGWTQAEITSALARKQRSGRLDAAGRARTLAAWLEASRAIALVDVVPGDFARVASLVDSGPGLRAGDALHLAIVLRLGSRSPPSTVISPRRRWPRASRWRSARRTLDSRPGQPY